MSTDSIIFFQFEEDRQVIVKILIVDNFYKDPVAVRSLALKAKYRDVTQLNYPGFQSLNAYTSKALEEKIAGALGRPLNIDLAAHTFGKFRIMLRETGSRLKVHLDGASDWTGVLYLNPTEQCLGGTAFYRHRRTGLEGRVSTARSRELGYDSWAELEQSIIEPDSLNHEAWEEMAFVGMKFNRLVLFKGNELFHCHTHSFGENWENGRMTQNFFFDEAEIEL